MSKFAAYFKTKSAGFYVALAALVLTVLQFIIYGLGMPEELYNLNVLFYALVAIAGFAVLIIFKQTAELAPIPLMVCSLLNVATFVSSEGLIDYVSTEFFDGVTLAKFFHLHFAVWFSVIAFVLIFLLASVAMYLRQNKKDKRNDKETSAKEVQDENA